MSEHPRVTARKEGKEIAANPRVGMPAAILLDEFGAMVADGIGRGVGVFHVGSSLEGRRDYHDVDVRLMLTDEEYEEMGLGDPDHPHSNFRWRALVLAFSALGRQMTGLPIDFQIQQMTKANNESVGHPRSALGTHTWIARMGLREKREKPDSVQPERACVGVADCDHIVACEEAGRCVNDPRSPESESLRGETKE